MMRQYQRIRATLPSDVLLLFRLGDFYELFAQDAILASSILNVTLTKRQDTPMCGVPFHAAEHYIGKLIQAGKRVAICEQKGEVRAGQFVEREVTQVVSAGTVTDPRLLDAGANHYLAAAFHRKGNYGFAYLDLTTGTFRVAEIAGAPALLDELTRVAPAEFLISDDAAQALAFADLARTARRLPLALRDARAAAAGQSGRGVSRFGVAAPRAVLRVAGGPHPAGRA